MKYYTLEPRQKALFTKVSYVFAAAAVACAFVATNVVANHRADAKTIVDTSACNYEGVLTQYDATMPAGTVRQNTNPEFVMSGSSLCGSEMSVRFVLTTTPYVYDFATNTYTQLNLNGYPFTEITRDNVVKPGVFSVRFKGIEYNVNQVTQMKTQVTAYMSSSFDASGRLLPGAVPLATDQANWTKTNFITL